MTNPEFKLLFQAYTRCHPHNMNDREMQYSKNGWWNGVNVLVHDPENQLKPMYPPIPENRDILLNDHIVHSDKYGFLAPDALNLYATLRKRRFVSVYSKLRNMRNKVAKQAQGVVGEYPTMNTFSGLLPEIGYNPSIADGDSA